jgi:hypothetical protein
MDFRFGTLLTARFQTLLLSMGTRPGTAAGH